MKYIDADCLRKEVKRLEKAAHKFALGCADSETRKFHEGKDFAYQYVGILLNSLQQEQSEMDLKKEVKEWEDLMVGATFPEEDGDFISEEVYRSVIRQTAIHFLSFNAKEDKQ